jgi:excisionase family DNA binding protein
VTLLDAVAAAGIVDDAVERVALRVAELLAGQLAPADRSPWLDVGEAAGYLRCKPKRIYDLVSQRRIPVHRDGSRVLFRRDELDAYLFSEDDAVGALLTPVPDRPSLRAVPRRSRTSDSQVRGGDAA